MYVHAMPPVQIRPARPEDAGRLPDFVHSLSERSYYRRFSAPRHPLSPAQIREIACPDSQEAACLVAVERAGPRDLHIVGLAQLFGQVGADVAEGALAVSDRQQRRGLGSALSKGLLGLARERRIGTLWGLVQPDNHSMLALARKLGYPPVHTDLGCELRVPISPR